MVQFYFTGAHLEFLVVWGLIFSKIGTNFYQGQATNNIGKHHKAQSYFKYFLILFLAAKKPRVQEFT